MENRWYAEQAVKAALEGDREKVEHFMDQMNDPNDQRTVMFLRGYPDKITFRGKEMTMAEFRKLQELDERMGIHWIHSTLDIK